MNEEQFVQYLTQFEHVAGLIHDSRASGLSIQDSLEQHLRVHGHTIPIEQNCYTKMYIRGHYARMHIQKMHFYDIDGNMHRFTRAYGTSTAPTAARLSGFLVQGHSKIQWTDAQAHTER